MVYLGIILILAGGLAAGTSPWPLKVIKIYTLQEMLFISQFFGMFVIPWIMFFCICNVSQAYEIIGLKNLFFANIFSFVFGIANILGMICLTKIGFVTAGVLVGVTSLIVSTLTPLIFKGSGVFRNAPDIGSVKGHIIIFALVILTVSVILITLASNERDKQSGKKNSEKLSLKQDVIYKILCFICGLMSPGLLLLNAYYGPVFQEAVLKSGCPKELTAFGLWTFGMMGCIFVSCVYCVFYIIKNRTYRNLMYGKDFLRSVCSGFQYIVYLILFGYGSVMMGVLGACVGAALSQCSQTGGQQVIGFVFGEWKGVKGKPVNLLIIGLVFLFAGIIILSLTK